MDDITLQQANAAAAAVAAGAVIGAIGVSGSTVENDHLVAEAGEAAAASA